jgi:hypothetical protein
MPSDNCGEANYHTEYAYVFISPRNFLAKVNWKILPVQIDDKTK